MRDDIPNLLFQLLIGETEILFGHLRLLKSKDLGGSNDDILTSISKILKLTEQSKALLQV